MYIYLFFHCLNLARLYTCIILIVISYVFIIIFEHCVCKNWTWLNNNLCTEFLFLLEYDGFFTLFRIIVVFTTYVCKSLSFISFLSFYFSFSLYVYMRYYMWYDTCILLYYSIFENVFKWNITTLQRCDVRDMFWEV